MWAPAAREIGEPFGRWRDAFNAMRPAYYRLMLDWPSVQPKAGEPANFDQPNGGCMRRLVPCGTYNGVRDQLRAAASQQKRTGMEVLVVITGTPTWAARPGGGCERAGTAPRSRAPRTDALPAYRALVADTLAAARTAGVRLRFWSPWNEPNHPYFISPQRTACSGSAPSASLGPYVEMARALVAELDEAPGEQKYVLGELASLPRRKANSTALKEFIRGLPSGLVCGARAWSQHGYIGGRDPADDVAKSLAVHGCPRAPEIWMTETGVGAPKTGRERALSAGAQLRACRAMHRRLKRWYEDPRVTAAFQYTLREDDMFPTGLISTDLTRGYPVLGTWVAWGARRSAEAPPPRLTCT